MFFDELDLSDDILDALDAMHFGECTPIQEQAIPVILSGRDLIAIAQTGTGKTAAYLLPVLDLLADTPRADAVKCIVMAPTRELAQQIECQIEGFSYYLDISSLAVYGGTDGVTFGRQQRAMREGADVVIATPGRLQALLQTGGINLSKVDYFILDEADRMLDMGFYDDIMRIAKQLPSQRQTLLFSATMPPRIRKLAAAILHDPAEVKIAPSRPVEKIVQSAIMTGPNDKDRLLLDILKGRRGSRTIVFAGSKLGVRDLGRYLRRNSVKAAEIHSDLDQQQRDDTINDFRAGRTEVIVATDLLARGIDIDDVMLVVNYDVPREPEDYVHRIGRTARANADGEAVTLVSPRDRRAFSRVESTLGIRIPVSKSSGTPGRADKCVSDEKPCCNDMRHRQYKRVDKPKDESKCKRRRSNRKCKPVGKPKVGHNGNAGKGIADSALS